MTSFDTAITSLSFAIAIAIAAASPAQAAGDAARGEAIALRWCSSCHAMDRPRSASDAAPALATVAREAGGSPERLRVWLAAPHPPMPNPGLSRRDIDDVTAYLTQLGASR